MAKLITDYPVERDALLCVMSEDCKPKGWKVELLVEKLSSKVEDKLLLCSCCTGLLRDACICSGALMCQVCIPKDIGWQPVEMNRQIVNEKMIYCPLKWRGCEWSDRVSAVVHHLEDCLYFPVTCPLGCVSLEGERGHISEHVRYSCPLRIVVCEFCEGGVKASEMNPHLEDCEGFPLPCPNGCSREGEEGMRELKRKDIPVHLANHCPLQRVQCPYWDNGCREEMERRHTDTHEREFMHIHFKLSIQVLNAATGRIALLEKQNSEKDLYIASVTKPAQLLQHELDIAGEKLAVQELKFAESTNVATNRIGILEKQNSDKDLQIASLGKSLFTYTLLPTGKLEWNVQGVQQKIQNKDITYSDPFYVGLYKCQSCVGWDYSNTKNVGVFIHIMKGDFDAKLHWPIRYKFTFALINRIINRNSLVDSVEVTIKTLEKYPDSFKRPTGYRNGSFGNRFFISHAGIIEEKYCTEDSITLHISVEVLPPL